MEFYNIFFKAHQGFGYLELALVLAFLILLLVTMFGYSGKISKGLRKVTLFTMVFFHIQFLLGLFLVINKFMQLGASVIMKTPEFRFQYVEHPFAMLIAAVLMTIINKKLKTAETLTIRLMSLGLVAIALFVYAFPWARVFGS